MSGVSVFRRVIQRPMRWYRLAADQGLPEANHNLGLLYYSGFGADVNEREAFKRFRAAAKNELPESLYMLGLMVYFGKQQVQIHRLHSSYSNLRPRVVMRKRSI